MEPPITRDLKSYRLRQAQLVFQRMGSNGIEHDGPSAGSQGTLKHNKKGPGLVSQIALFAQGFVKHPNMVGWVLPSSRFLVNEVLKQIDWNKARVIVEYGPGVGAFTTKLLERMRPDAKLIALEINPDYCRFLQSSMKDPRFHLVQQSATEIKEVLHRFGFSEADYIISGIPFKTISHELRDEIVRKTHAVLSLKGSFLVYQFSNAVQPYLERVFERVYRDFELLNILPARLFYCGRSA